MKRTAGCLSFVALLGPFVAAQEPDPQATGRELRGQEPGRRAPGVVPPGQIASGWPILEWRQLTGDWGGLRDEWRELGIDPEVFLTTDASVVAAGGRDRGASAFRWLLDATVTIDGARLLGWTGSRFFADLQVQRGGSGSDDVGDLQGFSNIDSENRTQLAKLWYEQVLFDRAVRLKIGKADANTDFAYVENGFRFLNSSFGYSPTLLGFPSYPDAAFGVAAFVRPGAGLYAGAGVYDGAGQAGFRTGERGLGTVFGAPSDLFVVAELGRRWAGGRVGVGVHRHTGNFARFDGGSEDGTDGFYVVWDQTLWRPEADGERGLGAFCRYGRADSDVSAVAQHVGAGVEWTGPFAMRPDDACGLAVTWAEFSDAPGAGLLGSAETTVEAFYTWQATPSLRVKPDLQYVHDPGGAGLDDAVVLTLRCAVTF